MFFPGVGSGIVVYKRGMLERGRGGELPRDFLVLFASLQYLHQLTTTNTAVTEVSLFHRKRTGESNHGNIQYY